MTDISKSIYEFSRVSDRVHSPKLGTLGLSSSPAWLWLPLPIGDHYNYTTSRRLLIVISLQHLIAPAGRSGRGSSLRFFAVEKGEVGWLLRKAVYGNYYRGVKPFLSTTVDGRWRGRRLFATNSLSKRTFSLLVPRVSYGWTTGDCDFSLWIREMDGFCGDGGWR